MKYIKTLDELRQSIAENSSEDETVALVFLRSTFDAHDITAIKQADKWCDKVAVVALEKNDLKRQFLEQAGCDFYYQFNEPKDAIFIDCGVNNIQGTALLKTILAVMPNAVMTPIADLSLLKALRNVNAAFIDLFTLKEVETSDDVLSDTQQALRQQFRVSGADSKKIEKNLSCKVTSLTLLSHSDMDRYNTLNQKSFCGFFGDVDGKVWRDTIILLP